jgi:hypothetical protein
MTFPEIYERVLVQPLFRPFAEELVAELEPVPDDSLVDGPAVPASWPA